MFGAEGNNAGGTVDVNGHLGGMMTGLFWGMAFFPRTPSPSGMKLRMWGLILLSIFFSVQLACLFTVVHPVQKQ